LAALRDLLIGARHLFFAAMVAIAAAGGSRMSNGTASEKAAARSARMVIERLLVTKCLLFLVTHLVQERSRLSKPRLDVLDSHMLALLLK
jgi:hypothetical protein